MLVSVHRQYYCKGCFWCGVQWDSSETRKGAELRQVGALARFPHIFCSQSCAELAFEYYRGESFKNAAEKARWG